METLLPPVSFFEKPLTSGLGVLIETHVVPISYTRINEMKNNCYLFERCFKIQKNGVSFLEYFFFVLELLKFLYIMEFRKVMTSQGAVQLKLKNTESRISLEILERCSSDLAPEMFITKVAK